MKIKTIFSLKVLVVSALFLSLTSVFTAQTPGMIYEPATGAGAAILDPNGDGYTSATTAGFTTDDQLQSEIPYSSLIFPGSEPTSDLNNAPDCGFTDFVDQGDRDPAQKYLSPAGNWLFRLRMGSISPNAKSYSILIDTDGLFGNTGANADPNWTVNNPGFEIEIVLATKFGVYVYNVNTPNCTPVISYPGTTNYQKSIAGSLNCGDLDYFLDFYVVFADLVAQFPGLNVSTPMRYVIVDNTAAQASTICQPSSASDVGGVGQCATLSACFTEIINAQAFCSPNTSICTYRSDCPIITLPIANGATSVSGTSTEASGTTIKVYKNGVQIGTTTVGVGGAWTLSGISPALVNGNVITATATATGEYESLSDCNAYTIITCTGTPVAAPVVTSETGKNFCGTGLIGYDINVMYPNNTEFTPNPVSSAYLPVPTGGSWVWKCTGNTGGCNSGSGVDCIPEGGYMIYQQGPDGCLSYPAFVCLSIGGGYSPVTSPTPTIVASTVVSGSTSVGVTVTFNAAPSPQGGYVHLFLNGMPYAISSYITAAGTVNISCPALPGCATLTAYFVQSTNVMTDAHDCYSAASTAVSITGGASTPPIINGPLCISSNLTSVSGTSVEANGTSVQLYVNAVATGAPVLVNNGSWTVTGLNIASGSTLTATATASCESVSALSTSVTVTSQSASTGLSITTSPVFEQGTTLSGTGTNGTQVQVYIDGYPIGSPVTVSGGVWTLSGIQSYELYPYGVLTATATSAGGCPSVPVTGATVQCILPSGSLTVNPASAEFCAATGTVSVQISNSQTGVVYQLFLADGTTQTGSSLMGNGGALTLTSGTLSASTTLKVKAFKLPPGACFIFETDEVPVSFGTNPTLNLSVSASPSVVCSGGSSTITIANSQVGFSYQLRNNADNSLVGTAVVGTGSNITINTGTVASTTTYNVLVTGPSPTLCSGQLTNTVSLTINGNPTANAGFDQTVCSGITVTLSGSASGGTGPYVYTWNNSVTNNTAFTPLSTNTYTVTATDANGCSAQDVVLVTVNITPNAPTVNTAAATCASAGTATITNYSGTQTYTFAPAGPTAGSGGVISGMTAGTSYSVTTTNTSSCTSVASTPFSIAAQLTTPSAPTVSTAAATCASAGTATITNYSGTQTYTFAPSGPTAGSGGVISGMTAGTSYSVTTTNTSSCTSLASTPFSIAAQLTTPNAPTVSTAAATCASVGTATITNYSGTQTYTFAPSGPTAGSGGVISGMTAGTSYTVTTTNTSSCTSVASTPFSIAAQLTTPSAPTVSTAAATCASAGTATITNYSGTQTYTFTPAGPTAGSGGVISGMTAGTSYSVTTTNTSSCTSVASTPFSIAAQLTTPNAPTVSTAAATCASAGTATITNYSGTQTYTFAPSGPTAGSGGVISGMTAGTSYTVTTTNTSSCTSVASSSFSIAAQLTTPSAPTVNTAAATCASAGTATITNYSGTQTYTFTPSGPTAGAGGVISGMTAGTSYTVTTTNTSSCTSVASSSFSIAAQLTTPSAPTVNTAAATCASAGTATITNYSGTQTYTFAPAGPTAGSGGVISGMTAGTSYSVTTTNTSSCTSVASTPFSIAAQLTTPSAPTVSTAAATCASAGTATITNYSGTQTYTFAPSGPTAGSGGVISGMTAGTSYSVTTTNTSSCTSLASTPFSIAAQLTTPNAPTVSTAAATCASVGTATITNYSGTQTYTFAPSGPTAGSGGVISGMTAGTSYTVTTTNTSSCTSVASTPFSIAAQLTTPSAPTVSTAAATCASAGTATITNYSGTQTYTFTPAGPTAGSGGVISGMTAGTSYSVTTTNTSSCTSVASTPFSIAAQLTTPNAPTVSTAAATCASAGTATITNYSGTQTYTFAPSGPTAGSGGVISGMTAGTSYTVTTTNTSSCTSVASSSFSIAAQLTTPSAPTVNTAAATCASAGTATITNYSGTQTYTFTPSGPTAGAGGVISGMTAGTSYTVTTTNTSSCTSVASSSFSIAAQLTTPSAPTVNTAAATCASAGTATITNYSGTQTYTFTPAGPTAGSGGVISGMTGGTSYTVTTTNTSGCTSVASSSFSIAVPLCGPTANDNSATTNEEQPVVISSIQSNDTDVDGTVVTSTIDLDPTTPGQQTTITTVEGTWVLNTTTGNVTFTPVLNYNGTATITYTIQDNAGLTSNAANIVVTVNPVNDPPVVDNDANTINEDQGPATGDLTDTGDSDPDGTTLVVNTTPVDGPNNGSITINADGTYSYTPNAGFNGQDTIVVSVCDSGTPLPAQCVNDTLVITVTPINDAPNAVDDVASTNEDSPVTIDVTNNDTDSDGSINDASVTIVTNPSNGTVTVNPTTGEVTYTPNPGYNGTDSFVYSVCDNGTPLPAQCDQATVTITVNPVNDPPVVDNDANTINEDEGPATGDLTDTGDSDPDGTTLVVNTTPVDGPNNGTITINADGTYSYTPNAGFNGQDTIVVSVCDSGTPLPAQCVNDTLVITVTPINDAPNAVDDVASTNEDSPVTIDVTNNDTDSDGSINDASVTIVTNPSNGTVTVNPTTGEVTYTPNPGYNGTDSFVYSVCDNGTPLPAQCDQATVTITVNPVNDPPVVDNDANTINEDEGPATGDLTDTGDSDPDGTTLVVNTTPVDGPNNGTITINADGTYSYTPNAGFNGQDTIVVSVCDSGTPLPAQCVNDTLVITVTPINDAPNAVLDNSTTNENITVVISVTTNDTDTDGNINNQSVTITDNPTNGTVTVNSSNGQITYTPNNGFIGTDTLIYQVCDNGTPLPAACDTAMVIINVLPCGTDLTADCDGDGVTNGDEIDPDGDGTPGPNGTDPSNPCSLNLADQTVAPSQAWLDADCDGDGVINSDEVDPDGDGTPGPNGTNPSDPCSFNAADQDLATVSQAWLDADCDGDGVTNGDEVDPDGDGTPGPNGTNPSDPCSFNVADQDLATVSQAWLDADCDGDGVTNGDEVDPDGDGTPGPNGTNPSDPCSFNVTDQDLATVSQAWLDADCDGDGVTNGDEVDPDGDGTPGPNGTNPSDPCSFNVTDQDLATVSQAWLDADCDGDGVTNGDEVDPDGDGTPGPNGTNPSDPCSFNLADQDLATVSQAWLDADCDGDGVTNGDEVDPDGDGTPGPNGTNPSDPCSFNLADQDLATVSQAWLDADCDGDGVTNGDEVDPDGDGTPGPNGTNPSDPCSFNLADQDLATVSQAWLDADCDGDGLTNGEEVDPDGDGTPGPNGTNPSDPCSFDLANQDFASANQAWLDADCDGDGVTNGNEIDPDGDGTPGPNATDPTDPCSLNVADQTVSPSQAWLDADCDGDGLTNGEEINGGSNPLDPCDPNTNFPGCNTDISIPEAFTPDGDNTNDLFVIPGIENYPLNNLTFFNRWGNEVFFAQAYNNTWDGTPNRGIIIGDSKLPTGTYYYILDLNGDGETIYKGYVYLKR